MFEETRRRLPVDYDAVVAVRWPVQANPSGNATEPRRRSEGPEGTLHRGVTGAGRERAPRSAPSDPARPGASKAPSRWPFRSRAVGLSPEAPASRGCASSTLPVRDAVRSRSHRAAPSRSSPVHRRRARTGALARTLRHNDIREAELERTSTYSAFVYSGTGREHGDCHRRVPGCHAGRVRVGVGVSGGNCTPAEEIQPRLHGPATCRILGRLPLRTADQVGNLAEHGDPGGGAPASRSGALAGYAPARLARSEDV